MIDALPVAPSPVNSPAEFDTNAFNFLAALATFRNQANSTALEVQNNADITAALALSMALPNYGGTSTTSLAIGTGAKSFVTQAGKSWTVGQVVVASNGAAYMKGTVTSYSGTALGVNVTSVVGSGTFASWTIGLSYTSLGLAPRAPRVDVATVAGTVDLTAAAPDSDDIQFTGSNAMTGFTAKAGRVFRFVVKTGDAPLLVESASIKTQRGVNLQLAGGDSGELRVVTDNVVELLNYSPSNPVPNGSVTPAKLAQPFTPGTAVATTSGTSKDWPSIPSWVQVIDLDLFGVSLTQNVDHFIIQIGTGGSPTTSGYLSSGVYISSGSTNGSSTAGLMLPSGAAGNATITWSGKITITRISSTEWEMSGQLGSDIGSMLLSSGRVTLAGQLDNLRLTSNGTSSFDAGKAKLSYYG